ncbi:MAG: hypothetical protein ACK4JA_08445, partial [Parazoarcus communis]
MRATQNKQNVIVPPFAPQANRVRCLETKNPAEAGFFNSTYGPDRINRADHAHGDRHDCDHHERMRDHHDH